jgi:hypothetical protein
VREHLWGQEEKIRGEKEKQKKGGVKCGEVNKS